MDLASSFNKLSVDDFPGKVHVFAALVGDHHTEFILVNFSNAIHLFITQYYKIGNIYQVKVDLPENGISIAEPVYNIKQLLGAENIAAEVALRYLTEKLKIRKKLLASLTLKNFDKENIDTIVEVIVEYKKNGSGQEGTKS
ncbi:unnamed protein product [Acanthoscelides obtectus]|uniref:Proteasome assembly chaperone 3 n=1 Tax=Acanthoscelides obtectus TaxID=200917 RepID=A0A9P0PHX3_ACAOB|nr:unnamed protein product [Acanthoscelides obtectus]CAK1675357.1 hypothetical protein AOBTE_LOCUS30161 [Acanthoscelides obtectus]